MILDHLSALTDPVRCRMLLLLERHELTVGELCSVLQLPQSTVSRHLKTLADAGWAASRRDGTSRYYSGVYANGAIHPQLWKLVRKEIAGIRAASQDARRLEGVLAARRTKSQRFFASAAGEWDRLRNELFGPRFFHLALLGLVDSSWTVGDLGCGTGQVSACLAPFVERIVAVDASTEMLRAAQERLQSFPNVELRESPLEQLPLEEGALDAAIMMLVLHHIADPTAVLKEAARVLRPGGKLLLVDMSPHEHEEYKQQMGHVWLGFSDEKVRRYLDAAGLESIAVRPLPIEPDAKGPALFTAVACRPARTSAGTSPSSRVVDRQERFLKSAR